MKSFAPGGAYLNQAYSECGSAGGDSGAPILVDITGDGHDSHTWRASAGKGGYGRWGVRRILALGSGILQMYPGLRVTL